MTSAIPVQRSTAEVRVQIHANFFFFYRPEFFSGLIFTTAEVVFITAKIAFVLTSLFAVQIYDFHIFTVEYQGVQQS